MDLSYKKDPLKQKMATWMMHLRVAEHFRTKLGVDEIPFIVGNIGPDCGEPTGEWGQYDPPSTITHYRSLEGEKEINAEAFFKTYLTHRESFSKKQVSFYIGYYVHLLTDIEFSRVIKKQSLEKYKELLDKGPKFKLIVRQDWNDLDHLYLRDNPDFPAFKYIESIDTFPNEYLDYYSDTAIIKRIKSITQFYQKGGENLDREYTYLTKSDVDRFLEDTYQVIKERLKEKQIYDYICL